MVPEVSAPGARRRRGRSPPHVELRAQSLAGALPLLLDVIGLGHSLGQLDVLGLPVVGNERKIKARLGIVPQEDNLDEQITVVENLTTYARYFGIKATSVLPRIDELLEFMQLSEKRERKITELSGRK